MEAHVSTSLKLCVDWLSIVTSSGEKIPRGEKIPSVIFVLQNLIGSSVTTYRVVDILNHASGELNDRQFSYFAYGR